MALGQASPELSGEAEVCEVGIGEDGVGRRVHGAAVAGGRARDPAPGRLTPSATRRLACGSLGVRRTLVRPTLCVRFPNHQREPRIARRVDPLEVDHSNDLEP